MQPSVYSRKEILEAAFALIRERGWSAVSTRAIAKKMGSSTMPIYSHIKSVEKLERELRTMASELQKEYQQKSYTEHVLLNLAFGYVVFARDEKHLFRFLYLESPRTMNINHGPSLRESFFRQFGADSAEAEALNELKASGQEALIQYTWIFTHGLATQVNADSESSFSDEQIMRLLRNAGEAFYLWGIHKGEGFND